MIVASICLQRREFHNYWSPGATGKFPNLMDAFNITFLSDDPETFGGVTNYLSFRLHPSIHPSHPTPPMSPGRHKEANKTKEHIGATYSRNHQCVFLNLCVLLTLETVKIVFFKLKNELHKRGRILCASLSFVQIG